MGMCLWAQAPPEALDALKLELQEVVRGHVCAGNRTQLGWEK